MSGDLVKSAARALEILEVFADRREPMTATELGTVLGYPKSSLSGLIKSLVTQGYIVDSSATGAYFPTLKLARLGEWIPGALLGTEALLPMLAALRDRTGETVTLTVAAGLYMRCLHAVIGTHPISLQVVEGTTFPTIGTAVGTMYLASQPDKVCERLFDQWVQVTNDGTIDRVAWRQRITEARDQGFTAAYDIVMPDTGAIAMPLQGAVQGGVMILAVAGLNHRIHSQQSAILSTMHALLPKLA